MRSEEYWVPWVSEGLEGKRDGPLSGAAGGRERGERPGGALLAVLIALMGVGPLFMLGLSASSALVVERTEISAGQIGTVAAVVFGSAALAAPSLGRLADAVSPWQQLALNFGGAAGALAIAALTTSFGWILVAAVFAGVSQAISNPTTNRVILEVVPATGRAGWIGMKQAGVPLAQFFAGIFFPAVAVWVGWTGAALSGVVLALFCAVCGLWVFRLYYAGNDLRGADQAPVHPSVLPRGKSGPRGDAPRAPFSAGIALLTLIAFLTGFSVQAMNVYLPLFSVEQMGFTLREGGLVLTVCGVLGMISRVWWAHRVSAGARLSTLLILMCGGAVGGTFLLLWAQLGGPPGLVWAAAAVHGITGLGANVVINAGVLAGARPGQIGRASGLASMGMYAGFMAGPMVLGWFRDLTGDFLLPWAIAGVSLLFAFGAALWLRRRRG